MPRIDGCPATRVETFSRPGRITPPVVIPRSNRGIQRRSQVREPLDTAVEPRYDKLRAARYCEPNAIPVGFPACSGEMSERSKEHAWKVCIPKGIEGSNPSLSAIHEKGSREGPFFMDVGKTRSDEDPGAQPRFDQFAGSELARAQRVLEAGIRPAVRMRHRDVPHNPSLSAIH